MTVAASLAVDNVIGLVIALALTIFLIVALVMPEKF